MALFSGGRKNGVYVRLGSTNRQADRELIAEIGRSVEGVSFDEMPMPGLSINDIDINVAAQSVQGKFFVDEAKLQTLKLLVPHQGRTCQNRCF